RTPSPERSICVLRHWRFDEGLATGECSTVRGPPSLDEGRLKRLVYRSHREDRNCPSRGTVDPRGSDELDAVVGVRALDQKHRIVLGFMTHTIDRIEAVHLVDRRWPYVVARRRRILDDLPSRITAEMCAAVVYDDDPDVPRRIVVVQVKAGRDCDVGRNRENGIVPF